MLRAARSQVRPRVACTSSLLPNPAKSSRTLYSSTGNEPGHLHSILNDNDFILSILRAKPSLRDSKNYLASFGSSSETQQSTQANTATSSPVQRAPADGKTENMQHPLLQAILNPVVKRTAIVKLQGPFTHRQLESVCRGLVYLAKLGLVSVIVVERDDWWPGRPEERAEAVEELMRITAALEAQGASARPVLDPIVRLGPDPTEPEPSSNVWTPEAHARSEDLSIIRSALKVGEIPVLLPIALDSFCRSLRVSANDVVGALTRSMVQYGAATSPKEIDLTPLRLMTVNREGGIPSYAREGLPHLLVNLTSEFDQIKQTFLPQWQQTHPTALSNLALSRTCLSYMPPSSSAVVVSHRSPSDLIANLITNKPAQSSSLPHALLKGTKQLTPHTPTLMRQGLPMRVIREVKDIDFDKLSTLLESSFRRTLDAEAFYARIRSQLDFLIVAGDYAGAAIVTNERCQDGRSMAYLDKFAVLPSHQGDGTVDFLWVALHDESYGLGSSYAFNFNEGSMQGQGVGRDLVWRSRANNPVNKWYFERSSGHFRLGDWVLFWCDAEDIIKHEKTTGTPTATIAEEKSSFLFSDDGRLSQWQKAVESIPSSWKV